MSQGLTAHLKHPKESGIDPLVDHCPGSVECKNGVQACKSMITASSLDKPEAVAGSAHGDEERGNRIVARRRSIVAPCIKAPGLHISIATLMFVGSKCGTRRVRWYKAKIQLLARNKARS